MVLLRHGIAMRRRRVTLVPLALLAACVGPAPAPPPRVDLQGHRGARGLAPENTLAAFDTALGLGVHTLELDTVLSADDVVLIAHDLTLNPNFARAPDGRYVDAPGAPIRTLNFAELQRYDVGRLRPGTRYAQAYPEQRPVEGERMPSLAQLFELVHRRGAAEVRFNVETKINPLRPDLAPEPEAFARAVLDVARRHGVLGRLTLQSFDWRTLVAAKRIAPEVPTVCLTSQQPWGNNVADPRWTAGLRLADHDGSVPRLVKAAGGAIWSPYHGDLGAAALREAHSLGLRVVVWTVNEPADIDRLLDLGVDGIISDRPDRVRNAFAARGWELPRAYPAPR